MEGQKRLATLLAKFLPSQPRARNRICTGPGKVSAELLVLNFYSKCRWIIIPAVQRRSRRTMPQRRLETDRTLGCLIYVPLDYVLR